jgi:hypothetical protein
VAIGRHPTLADTDLLVGLDSPSGPVLGDYFAWSGHNLTMDNESLPYSLIKLNHVIGINAGHSPHYYYVHLQRKVVTFDPMDTVISKGTTLCLLLQESSQPAPLALASLQDGQWCVQFDAAPRFIAVISFILLL